MLRSQILGDNNTKKSAAISSFDELVLFLSQTRDFLCSIISALDPLFNSDLSTLYGKEYQIKRDNLIYACQNLVFIEKEKTSIASIKAFLDDALDFRKYIKKLVNTISTTDNNTLQDFYVYCVNAIDELNKLPKLYKETFYFITKRPYSIEKYRLYFDCAAFGRGWDLSKEADYLVTLFKRENKFYLGIRRRGAVIDFEELEEKYPARGQKCYEKMMYKSFDFNKGFPAVVFSKLVLEKFAQGKEEVVFSGPNFNKPFILAKEDVLAKFTIYDGKIQEKEAAKTQYLKEYYTATSDYIGYQKAIHTRIEIAKRFIDSYKAFEFFDMTQILPTVEYTSWSEFVNHVNEFTYGIRWQKISEDAIKELVERGDLFFF